MRHILTFDELNEKEKIKYSENWRQTDNNWLKDITQAQTADRYVGKTIEHKGGDIPHQRELAGNIDPDIDWTKKSATDVRKFLNDTKNRLKEEIEISKAYFSIREKLEGLAKAGKISVQVFGDRCPDELKVRFAQPCIAKAMTPKEAWTFVKGTESLEIECTNRKVVNKWSVEYDGIITNSEGKTAEFKDVDNGLAVTLG